MSRLSRANNSIFAWTLVISISAFYAFQYLKNWPLLKLSGILGPTRYIDLTAIQSYSECVKHIGIKVYEISDSCGGYQYSLGVLYYFSYSHFSDISGPLAAIILELPVLALGLSVVWIAFKQNKKMGIYTSLAVMAPGNWLLLERGNLDLIMLLLILIAGITFGKKYEALGFTALIISVFTKFYTAPLLLVYLLFGIKKYKRTIYLPVTVVTILLSLYQISKVGKFPSTWYVSYGSGSIGHWINLLLEYQFKSSYRLPEKIGMLLGIFMLSIATVITLKILKFKSKTKAIPQTTPTATTLFFQLSFVACYLAGMNYDYRMFLPVGACLGLLFTRRDLPGLDYLAGVSLLSFWLSCFFFGQIGMSVIYQQLMGDIAVGLTASYVLTILLIDTSTYVNQSSRFSVDKLSNVTKAIQWAHL